MTLAPAERAALLADTPGPSEFEVDGLHVVLASRRLTDDGLLEVKLASAVDGERVLPLDDRYLFSNPPTCVPGRIRRKVSDPERALQLIVVDAVRHFAAWGNPGNTTLSVFAGTTDGQVTSNSAVYATARSGAGLGADTAGTTILIGQRLDVTYQCCEGFFAFDTSTIPDAATIDSVTLSLFGQADNSVTDFTLQARASDWGTGLTTADWVAGASLGALTLLGSLSTVGFSTAAYNDFTENGSNFRNAISKTGETRILVNGSTHEAGSTPTGYERVTVHSADASGTTNDPKLVVNYSEGGGSNTRRMLLGIG